MNAPDERPQKGLARIPLLEPGEMSAEQRTLYDEIVSGPRGRLVGPLRAAIHSPEMATLWSRFGEFLRYRTCLPVKLKELAIIATARRWTSQVEWSIHVQVALDAGISADVVRAIQNGETIRFSDPAEFEIYEYCRELQTHGKVSEQLHTAIVQRWGVRGVVELTALIGYYTMVAMTLNAHQLPLADGVEEPLVPEDTLFELARGAEIVGAR